MKNLATLLIAAAVTFTVSGASAQALSEAPQTQSVELATSLMPRVTNSAAPSAVEVSQITRNSVKSSIYDAALQIPQTTLSVLSSELRSTISSISAGESKSFAIGTAKTESLLDHSTVSVKVSYDPRPIGGILNVSVDLVPTFSGIGMSNRSIASRSLAVAVDEINEQVVKTIVENLTNELSNAIALK